ncbi:MAG TPA: hypothetical protein VJ783_13015, partial [Pirellulales bacterium]|nr:hypothetical protein [Pirellulales bacterium]
LVHMPILNVKTDQAGIRRGACGNDLKRDATRRGGRRVGSHRPPELQHSTASVAAAARARTAMPSAPRRMPWHPAMH